MRYFDASALVKRYVRETGSVKVRRLLSSDVSATSRLSAVEITSALMRRSREGAFVDAERDRAFAVLSRDMAALLVVELTPDIVARAQAVEASHAVCVRCHSARQLPLPAGGAWRRDDARRLR